VFLVGHLGDWRRAAAVLFEPEGMRWDHPPRREAGQIAAPTIASRTTGGGGLGTDFDCDGGLIASNSGDVGYCLAASAQQSLDAETETLIAVAHPLRAQGQSAHDDTLETYVSYAIQERAVSENPDAGPDGIGVQEGHAYTLEARNNVQAVAAPLAFPAELSGTQVAAAENVSPALSVTHTMAVCQTWAVRRLTPRECERLQGFQFQVSPDYPGAWQDSAGRWWSPDYTAIPWRGKAADACPDGPRYKALGNSMAVNCMMWLGQRIQTVENLIRQGEV
jgi:DNA (cytosine-5)-methyltransferase 1